MNDAHTAGKCAGCSRDNLHEIIDFGSLPLAGAFPKRDDAHAVVAYPLSLAVCLNCFLVQVPHRVDPKDLFRDYRYLASVPLARHYREFAEHVPRMLNLETSAGIVEIGCNDGVLLHPLLKLGYSRLLGIDPAENITANIDPSIPVINAFFSNSVAKNVVQDCGTFDLAIANNVFAHLDDPHDFLSGIATLLGERGTFVFEVHYVCDLLDQGQFDTIYHEHRYYYSLSVLHEILRTHGLDLFDAERIANHGGSVRAYARLGGVPSTRLLDLLKMEERLGIRTLAPYDQFRGRVKRNLESISELIGQLPHDSTVAAYGAAGRAVTYLNVVPREVSSRIRYVVDDSPERVGRVIPGVNIPIVGRDRLVSDPPGIVLVTAWTYARAIMDSVRRDNPQHQIQFVTPFPEARYL